MAKDLRHMDFQRALLRQGFKVRSVTVWGTADKGDPDIWSRSPNKIFVTVEAKNSKTSSELWSWSNWTQDQIEWGRENNPDNHWIGLAIGDTRPDAKVMPRLAWLIPWDVLLQEMQKKGKPKHFTYEECRNLFGEYCLVWSNGGWDIPPMHDFYQKYVAA